MNIGLLILYSIIFLVFIIWNIVLFVKNYKFLSHEILVPVIVFLILGVFTGFVPFFILSIILIYRFKDLNKVTILNKIMSGKKKLKKKLKKKV
tara:strand:- start:106 stop:384 length:279 start_codon:yes stop_codon:yes gene_type:complete